MKGEIFLSAPTLVYRAARIDAARRVRQCARMSELIFEVTQEADGGFVAECLTESIVTEGDTWEQLRANVQEAVRGFWFDAPASVPGQIRLRLVRDEVLATA